MEPARSLYRLGRGGRSEYTHPRSTVGGGAMCVDRGSDRLERT